MYKTMGLALAATGSLTFVGVAGAATADQLIPGTDGTKVLLSDENREELINRGQGQDNIIDVGDSISGVFAVEQLFVDEPGHNTEQSYLLHAVGNSELSGEFQLLVVDKTATGRVIDGNVEYSFVFGVDPDFADDGQTLIRVFEDNPGGTTFNDNLDDSKSTARDVTTDGDLFLSAGLVSSENFFAGTGFEDITLTGNSSFRIGQSIFALDRVGGSFSETLVTLSQGAGSGQFIGVSNIGPGLDGSAWELSSNTNFNFQIASRIIPTPAALGPGLALLGMMFARRRRRAA